MPADKTGFRINRTYAVAAHDVVMAAASFVLALLLRRGVDNFLHESGAFLAEGLLLFTAVCTLVFWRTRIYRGFWRYTSLSDVAKIVQGASLSILIFLPLLFAITRLEAFPRSALIINWFVLLALLIGPRIFYRAIVEGSVVGAFQRGGGRRIPVVLVGAGDAAELFLRAMTRDPAANYWVVGLVDDDPAKIGRHIRGVRVFGEIQSLPNVVRQLRQRGMAPQRLILTSDELSAARVRTLLSAAEGLGLTFSRMPKLTDFRSDAPQTIEVKPIAVEDLLRRPQTVLDREAMRALIKGKRVCVTGAGGTIGSELSRQIADYEPEHIALIDNAEYNLYAIDIELADRHPNIPRTMHLGDVRDRRRLDTAFARERPALVFHAAALKHVPMVEANPNEGVLTNVLGTRNVAEACVAARVETMVLISTDKAVNPASVMGATKRIAEGYCQALGATLGTAPAPVAAGEASRPATRFVTVRFGNVLGSTGSVVPLFQRQIAAGGPITVGAEIFVLDMGLSVKIQDLARQMIRLAGLTPDKDIAIEYTGLRPGEKLHEELFHDSESMVATELPGIQRAKPRDGDLNALRGQLDQLASAAHARLTPQTLALIHAIVPEFAPDDDAAASQARGGAP
jgi:O-antigen biosynthesis protein WbqV